MIELIGDSARGSEFALVRLTVDGDHTTSGPAATDAAKRERRRQRRKSRPHGRSR